MWHRLLLMITIWTQLLNRCGGYLEKYPVLNADLNTEVKPALFGFVISVNMGSKLRLREDWNLYHVFSVGSVARYRFFFHAVLCAWYDCCVEIRDTMIIQISGSLTFSLRRVQRKSSFHLHLRSQACTVTCPDFQLLATLPQLHIVLDSIADGRLSGVGIPEIQLSLVASWAMMCFPWNSCLSHLCFCK